MSLNWNDLCFLFCISSDSRPCQNQGHVNDILGYSDGMVGTTGVGVGILTRTDLLKCSVFEFARVGPGLFWEMDCHAWTGKPFCNSLEKWLQNVIGYVAVQ